jgi:hypothetical protein
MVDTATSIPPHLKWIVDKEIRKKINESNHKYYRGDYNDPNIASFYKRMYEIIETPDDVNHKNEYGRTLLMYAAINKDTYMIRYLLRRGASINIVDNDGNDVFYYTWNKFIRQRIRRATVMKLWDGYSDSYDYLAHIKERIMIEEAL